MIQTHSTYLPSLIAVLPALTFAVLAWFAVQMASKFRPAALGRWRPSARVGVWVAALGLGWITQSYAVALLGMLIGPWYPRVRAWLQRRRLQQDLALQLPTLLEALVGGLRAGLSLPQALAAAEEDLPMPSAALARRLCDALSLGADLEVLLQDEARSHGKHSLAADWRLLATAVGIQRGSGGDLAGTLDQLTETLRERQRLQAQVDALTAQGRLSAWVLGLLPFVLMLALQWMDPEILAPLFHTTTGWVLLGLAAVFETAGLLLLWRIVDIEA